MKLGFTLHSVIVGKERSELPISSVQPFDESTFRDLLKLGAIRVPTDAEIAIFESQSGNTSKNAAKTSAKAAKTSAKAAKTSAKAPESVNTSDDQKSDAAQNNPDEVVL